MTLHDRRSITHRLERQEAIQRDLSEPEDARDSWRDAAESMRELADAVLAEPQAICAWCGVPLEDEQHYPFCSTECGVRAETDR